MSPREREKPTEVGDAAEGSNTPEPVVDKGFCGIAGVPLCGERGGDTLTEAVFSRTVRILRSPPVITRESELVIGKNECRRGIEIRNELPRAFESYPQRFFPNLKARVPLSRHQSAYALESERISTRKILVYY